MYLKQFITNLLNILIISGALLSNSAYSLGFFDWFTSPTIEQSRKQAEEAKKQIRRAQETLHRATLRNIEAREVEKIEEAYGCDYKDFSRERMAEHLQAAQKAFETSMQPSLPLIGSLVTAASTGAGLTYNFYQDWLNLFGATLSFPKQALLETLKTIDLKTLRSILSGKEAVSSCAAMAAILTTGYLTYKVATDLLNTYWYQTKHTAAQKILNFLEQKEKAQAKQAPTTEPILSRIPSKAQAKQAITQAFAKSSEQSAIAGKSKTYGNVTITEEE